MDVASLLKYVAKGVIDQSVRCVEVRAKCLDPPALTSGMLKKYGLHSEHTILNFWKNLDKVIESRSGKVCIYRSRFMDFFLLLIHNIDEVYYAKDIDMYLDPIDCNNHECVSIPHTHVLKIYLEGAYKDRTRVKLNLVHVLAIAISRDREFSSCLKEFSENPLSMERLIKISMCVHRMMKNFRSVLSKLMDRVPEDFHSFVNISPLLRKLLKL